MKKYISPDEITRIEQELEGSSLDECTIRLIKGLIAGQYFILDLVEKLIKGSGHERTNIIKELAKILEIDLKKKAINPPENPSKGNPTGESNEGKGQSEESPAEEQEHPEDKEQENSGEGPDDKGDNEEDPPKKEHPKRGNDEYNPVAIHVHHHKDFDPGDRCPECLKGRLYPFREKVIPVMVGRSPLAYEEHRLLTLRCNACGALFEPKLPAEIPRVGNASPSAQAVITVLHYQIGVPFSSMSDFQKMFEKMVSPAQLWDAIEQAVKAVMPIYRELEKEAANSWLFYTDDTTARILSHYPSNKENREKKGKNKDPCDRVGTYTSIIIGCTKDSHKIYLYYHGRKYAGENLTDLLKRRDTSLAPPLQMRDASTMNVPGDTEVVDSKCNTHAIRKFKDIRDIYPKWCDEVLHRYGMVNKAEQMLKEKGVSDAERLAYHKEHSLPEMEWIRDYLNALIDDKVVEPNSSLGQAIAYFRTHFKELTAFCRIEGAQFDNNLAERGLKMVIRLRKVSMFYKTEHGADVAGILQSVIYTAKEAGVNPLTYLQTVMENADEVRKNARAFFPWNFQATKAGDADEALFEESLEAFADTV